jgi:hypothetical protein
MSAFETAALGATCGRKHVINTVILKVVILFSFTEGIFEPNNSVECFTRIHFV